MGHMTPAPKLHLTGGPCVAYARVSTEDQARPDRTSITDQTTALGLLASRTGLMLEDGQIYRDEGRSGATAEGRPAFMALVNFCQSHPQPSNRPGHVLVLNDSRWGRFDDPEEATYWRVTLKKSGWLVRFAENDDVADPLGRGVLRTIHQAQSSAYREAIRANAKRGRRGTAEKGFWANREPLGYRRQAIDPKTGRTRVLEPGERKGAEERVTLVPGPEAEQQIITWMFEQCALGQLSLGGIARDLERRHPGFRKWSRQVIRQILSNRAYLGEVYCRSRDEGGHRQPRSQWIVTERAHYPLVTPELFQRAQDVIVSNQKELRSKSGGYPLSGLIKCASCGEPYIGAGGPKGPPGDEDRYRFYRDRGGEKKTCDGQLGTLQARHIEPLVINLVARELSAPATLKAFAAMVDQQAKAHTVSGQNEKTLRREHRETEQAIDRLVGAVARGTFTETEAATQLADLRRRVAGIDAALEKQRTMTPADLAAEKKKLLGALRDFPALLRRAQGRPALVRALLRAWVEEIVVDKPRKGQKQRLLKVTIRFTPPEAAGWFSGLATKPGRG